MSAAEDPPWLDVLRTAARDGAIDQAVGLAAAQAADAYGALRADRRELHTALAHANLARRAVSQMLRGMARRVWEQRGHVVATHHLYAREFRARQRAEKSAAAHKGEVTRMTESFKQRLRDIQDEMVRQVRSRDRTVQSPARALLDLLDECDIEDRFNPPGAAAIRGCMADLARVIAEPKEGP